MFTLRNVTLYVTKTIKVLKISTILPRIIKVMKSKIYCQNVFDKKEEDEFKHEV